MLPPIICIIIIIRRHNTTILIMGNSNSSITSMRQRDEGLGVGMRRNKCEATGTERHIHNNISSSNTIHNIIITKIIIIIIITITSRIGIIVLGLLSARTSMAMLRDPRKSHRRMPQLLQRKQSPP